MSVSKPEKDASIAPQGSDWRMVARWKDFVVPGCLSCRVNGDADICRYCEPGHPKRKEFDMACPVARGRFRQVMRLGKSVLGPKRGYLFGALERFGIEEAKIAKMQLEKMKFVKDGEPIEQIRLIEREVSSGGKLASQYSRECGLAAHVGGVKGPGYDAKLLGG